LQETKQMTDPSQRTTLSIKDLASQYQVSSGAVEALVRTIRSGNGGQAKFNHPDLGGMGQWAGGNMIMIGDMFNHSLKDRVAKLCQAIASHLDDFSEGGESLGARTVANDTPSSNWWPLDLGVPSSTGAQNNLRYACFPKIHRLAVESDGQLIIYDTGAYRLSQFSPQQCSGQALTFTTQTGLVDVKDLRVVKS
jgi:hypothetical protein